MRTKLQVLLYLGLHYNLNGIKRKDLLSNKVNTSNLNDINEITLL